MEPTPTTNEPTTIPTAFVPPTPIAAVELRMAEVISTTQHVASAQSAAWSPGNDLSEPLLVLAIWVFLMWLAVFYRWGLLGWLKK